MKIIFDYDYNRDVYEKTNLEIPPHDHYTRYRDGMCFEDILESALKKENDCEYCNGGSRCEYWQDFIQEWYHDVRTDEWDYTKNDDWIYQREYGVKFCQYCGRRLK